MDECDIETMTPRLFNYTARESGVAILAETAAGRLDLFVDGKKYDGVLNNVTQGGAVIRLRSRVSHRYVCFHLIPPMAPELLTEMGEKFLAIVQARLTTGEIEQLLKDY